MKYADKIGAKFVMVLGDDEIANDYAKLKNMATGEETEIKLMKISSALFSAVNSSMLEKMAESFMKGNNI